MVSPIYQYIVIASPQNESNFLVSSLSDFHIINSLLVSEKEDTSLIDELKQVDNTVDVELLETNKDSTCSSTRATGDADRSSVNSGMMSKDRARKVEMSSTITPQPAQPRPFDSCESKTVGLGKGTYF